MRSHDRPIAVSRKQQKRFRKTLLLSLVGFWCGLLAIAGVQFWSQPPVVASSGVAMAATEPAATAIPGTVDVVSPRLQLGEQLYLKTCGSCHIAVPPQVLPSQTWQILIQDQNHYGATLPLLRQPELSQIWTYLRSYSRSLNTDEQIPYRVGRSRYFRILHPKVEVPQPVSLKGCVSCHPGAAKYNFRSLTPEWQNTP